MKHRFSFFSFVFVFVALLFSFFMAWYIPSYASLQSRMEETALSLETSRGRENKQQYEYDQVAEEIPQIRQKISQTVPLSEVKESLVLELKSKRKELRNEKKKLEEQIAELTDLSEDKSHE